MTEDGVFIRIDANEADELFQAIDLVWTSNSTPSVLLMVATDGSAVVGRDDPETKDLLFLPLALQLRGTLKDKAETSIKQVYRVGDGRRKPRGIFLSSNDSDTVNILTEENSKSSRTAIWGNQIVAEIQALFSYQAERPLHCDTPANFKETRISIGLNMNAQFSPREMSLICRSQIHDSHLHLGFNSLSGADQERLEKALKLALAGWLPNELSDVFHNYDIALLAGSPYNGTTPRIEAEAMGIGSLLGGSSKEDRAEALLPVVEAMRPILETVQPTAMVHYRSDIKASWTIARLSPEASSNHSQISARRSLVSLCANIT